MEMVEQMKAKIDLCRKEYNDKLCNLETASDKCKELLACIHQEDLGKYTQMAGLACEELCNDFWFPATLMALLMLFKVAEGVGTVNKLTDK